MVAIARHVAREHPLPVRTAEVIDRRLVGIAKAMDLRHGYSR